MLIILDGATTLLSAYPLKTKTDAESLKLFKEYVSTYRIQPRYVVGDAAFMGPDWEQYYQHFDIRPITLGAMTPWPNRAETAVRLFKRQVSLMLRAIQERTVHKTLASVTYRELLSAAALARNLSVTYGGVCPLELAFGRRPAELIQLDTALPNQLGEPTVEDLTAQQLRDLSQKTYIEARQSEDIRRDLAGKLRLSSKPIKVGDRALYWVEDLSKVKADGSKAGVWIKGEVLEGGMVALDLGTCIVKVNISKVRKDETMPPEELGIHIPDPPKRSATKAPASYVDDSLEDGRDPTNCYWNCETKGKIHLLEIFAGSARLSQCCAMSGMKVGVPIDIRTGFDLTHQKAVRWSVRSSKSNSRILLLWSLFGTLLQHAKSYRYEYCLGKARFLIRTCHKADSLWFIVRVWCNLQSHKQPTCADK